MRHPGAGGCPWIPLAGRSEAAFFSGAGPWVHYQLRIRDVQIAQTQQHVSSLEDRVQQICTTSTSEIKRFHSEFVQVHAQLEELLSLSTHTLGDLGKRLKGQAKEVDVTTRMAERSLGEIRKKNLTKGDNQGAKKVEALESLVSDLRVTRGALQEDIRNKSVLLDIDERCRKVTTTL